MITLPYLFIVTYHLKLLNYFLNPFLEYLSVLANNCLMEIRTWILPFVPYSMPSKLYRHSYRELVLSDAALCSTFPRLFPSIPCLALNIQPGVLAPQIFVAHFPKTLLTFRSHMHMIFCHGCSTASTLTFHLIYHFYLYFGRFCVVHVYHWL